MNIDRFREALRLAAGDVPVTGDRASGALRLASRRRHQRLVAASCATAALAVVTSLVVTNGASSAGLKPLPPVESPTEDPSYAPTDEPSADPTTDPADSPSPDAPSTPDPSEAPTWDGRPIPIDDCCPHWPSLPVRKLDVYVLLDATASMDGATDYLARALDKFDADLRDQSLDVQWGLGIYRDASAASTDAGFYPAYQRVRQIGPGVPRAAVQGVADKGGDSDSREGATFGFDGLRGVGHLPFSMDNDGAQWREGAYRLVLMVTDAGVEQGTQYPDLQQSLADLKAADVHVAVVVAQDMNNLALAQRDAATVAKGTDTSYMRAYDLNGDGTPDIARGDPMVLTINPGDPLPLAGPISDLVRS